MSVDDKAKRAKRASELRQDINKLIRGSKEGGRLPKGTLPKNPRDAIEERMRQLDKEKKR